MQGLTFLSNKVATTSTFDLDLGSEDFNALPIGGGYGEYNANQFRVYFRTPPAYTDPYAAIPKLVERFVPNFPFYFNGEEPPMRHNEALVEWGGERKFQDKDTLRFEMELELHLGSSTLDAVPNIHSDWIYVVWDDPRRGFAAQTLRRHFFEAKDWTFSALYLCYPWLVGTWIALLQLNKDHFLAGRRSWVFGCMQDAQGKPLYYLETAAIERYSSFMFKLAELDPGVIVDIRESICNIWITLLKNYLNSIGFPAAEPPPIILERAVPMWNQDDFVYYRTAEFNDEAACLEHPWILGELIPLHPALGEQLLLYGAPGTSRYYIQVGSFLDVNRAWGLVDRLATFVAQFVGYGIYVHYHWQDCRTYHQVLIGPFDMKMKGFAEHLRGKLAKEHPDLATAFVTAK